MNPRRFLQSAWIGQAVRFGLVGVLNTGVDLGLFFLLTHGLTFFARQPVLAKAVSYSVGLLNSYFINRAWTFRSRRRMLDTLPGFVLVNGIGLLINTGILDVALYRLHLVELVALALATAGSLLWNFILSRWLVFREGNPPATDADHSFP
jgi:putative flippase GtrA